jgi:hypothetical protein
MTVLHTLAIILSAIVLLAGSIAFLQKKWNFWTFYTVGWIGMAFLSFGILPSQFPEWSLLQQTVYVVMVSVAGFFFVKLLLKYLLGEKLK